MTKDALWRGQWMKINERGMMVFLDPVLMEGVNIIRARLQSRPERQGRVRKRPPDARGHRRDSLPSHS